MEENENPQSSAKKVLIISDLSHSSPRIPALCKYFPSYGWEPTIITPKVSRSTSTFNAPTAKGLQGITLVEVGESTSYEQSKTEMKGASFIGFGKSIASKINPKPSSKVALDMERAYWWIYYVRNFPDPGKAWQRASTGKAEELLSNMHYDLILSSSSPITTHIVAADLHQRYGIPWIAELRDLWSQNHNLPIGPLMVRKTRNLERKVLNGASCLVTVSLPWSEALGHLHRGKNVHCITNGYDPEATRSDGRARPAKFTISYTGQIYHGKQDPSLLMASLKRLIEEGRISREKTELSFYGPKDPTIGQLANQFGLEGVVAEHGVVSRDEAMIHQAQSHLLFLMNWDEKKEFGVIPLKLFEYMGSGAPILATGGKPGDEVSRILSQTCCGTAAYDIEDTCHAVEDCYLRWQNGAAINIGPCAERKRAYSFVNLSRHYCEIFNATAL